MNLHPVGNHCFVLRNKVATTQLKGFKRISLRMDLDGLAACDLRRSQLFAMPLPELYIYNKIDKES